MLFIPGSNWENIIVEIDLIKIGCEKNDHMIMSCRWILIRGLVIGFTITTSTSAQDTISHHVGGHCDGCEGIYEQMRESLDWQTTIPESNEPGEPLEIEGTIYKLDGKIPAPNVILYVYHTDATGHYSPSEGQTGNARRHGHLRGWLRSDSTGRYKC